MKNNFISTFEESYGSFDDMASLIKYRKRKSFVKELENSETKLQPNILTLVEEDTFNQDRNKEKNIHRAKEEKLEKEESDEEKKNKPFHTEFENKHPVKSGTFEEPIDDFLFFANSLQNSTKGNETKKLASTNFPKSDEFKLPQLSLPLSPDLPPRRSNSSLLKEFLDSLLQHECSWPFLEPVDEKEAPDYYSIVKNPMDFSKIKKKVDRGDYEYQTEMFAGDVRLIFQNCLLYNECNSYYYSMATNLAAIFEKKYHNFVENILINRNFFSEEKKITKQITWNENEDSRLKKLIDKYGEDWQRISKYFSHKTAEMCQDRAESNEFQSQDIIPRLRRNWNKDEDESLKRLVSKFGIDNWDIISCNMPKNARRSAAGCKNRWTVLESKKLDRTWNPEEEEILSECWKKYGHQWSKYHKYLPNKPYFCIRKRALELYEPNLA